MTEFKGLELVTMDHVNDNSNSEYKIILDQEFKWFLTNEFKNLREDFKPTDNKEFLNKAKSAVRKNTLVHVEEEKQEEQTEQSQTNNNIIDNNTTDVHRGKNADSKDIEDPPDIKAIRYSANGPLHMNEEK